MTFRLQTNLLIQVCGLQNLLFLLQEPEDGACQQARVLLVALRGKIRKDNISYASQEQMNTTNI